MNHEVGDLHGNKQFTKWLALYLHNLLNTYLNMYLVGRVLVFVFVYSHVCIQESMLLLLITIYLCHMIPLLINVLRKRFHDAVPINSVHGRSNLFDEPFIISQVITE